MGSKTRWLIAVGIGGALVSVVWWWRRRRAVPEATSAPAPEGDHVVDEAIAESFPASDPPAYAGSRGGAHDGG